MKGLSAPTPPIVSVGDCDGSVVSAAENGDDKANRRAPRDQIAFARTATSIARRLRIRRFSIEAGAASPRASAQEAHPGPLQLLRCQRQLQKSAASRRAGEAGLVQMALPSESPEASHVGAVRGLTSRLPASEALYHGFWRPWFHGAIRAKRLCGRIGRFASRPPAALWARREAPVYLW